ncbi:hypothetical protein BSLG_005030 [Batrachochytrium salamandrivorans]|nr:hypothetical protein BSLG_005030 [Batrachochytrium salamandrivorans]
MGEINWSSNHPAIRLLPDKHCKGNTKPYLCTVTYKGSIAPWKAGHSGHSKSSRRNREASPRPTLSYEETLLQVLRSVPRALSIQLPADPEYNIRKDRIPLSDTFTLSESAGFNGHFEGPARFGNATQFNTNLANARRGHITLKNGRFVMRDDWIDSPHQMARDSDAEFEFSQMDGKATMVFSRSSSGRLTARRARAHEIASPFRYSFKDIKAFAQDAIGRRPIGEDRADAEFNTSEYDTEMSISGAGSLASEESIPGQPYRSMALSENSAYDILISNHNSDHSQTKDQDESISGRTTLAINRKNNYRPSSDSAPSSHHHRSPQRDGGKKDIRELEQKESP